MLTIVWDVDDVLNDLMEQWFHKAWKRERPECRTAFHELSENPPHAALGVTREEYLASMDSFRRSQAGVQLTPNAEVLRWFAAHGAKARHIALTSRPLETAPDVAAWVMRHFGAWVRCFGVVPTRAPEGTPVYDRDKGEYLRWLGKGDVLVDDTRENLRAAAAIGMKTLEWPQPWNDSRRSTAEVLEELKEMTERA
jgi:FMN phosphatase YigB (HAD superfamily)